MAALQIRSDIQQQYASLFGEKSVNGRTLVVEDVIERLVQAIDGELQELLAERYAFQEQVARSGARYDFLPPATRSATPTATRPRSSRSGAGCSTASSDARRPTHGG